MVIPTACNVASRASGKSASSDQQNKAVHAGGIRKANSPLRRVANQESYRRPPATIRPAKVLFQNIDLTAALLYRSVKHNMQA